MVYGLGATSPDPICWIRLTSGRHLLVCGFALFVEMMALIVSLIPPIGIDRFLRCEVHSQQKNCIFGS